MLFFKEKKLKWKKKFYAFFNEKKNFFCKLENKSLITTVFGVLVQGALRHDSDFADRFERIFGWELPLGMLQTQVAEEFICQIFKILTLLLLSSPTAAERFLQGNMIQKHENNDRSVRDDLNIETSESESHKEDAPKTLNGFKLLERCWVRYSSVEVRVRKTIF